MSSRILRSGIEGEKVGLWEKGDREKGGDIKRLLKRTKFDTEGEKW